MTLKNISDHLLITQLLVFQGEHDGAGFLPGSLLVLTLWMAGGLQHAYVDQQGCRNEVASQQLAGLAPVLSSTLQSCGLSDLILSGLIFQIGEAQKVAELLFPYCLLYSKQIRISDLCPGNLKVSSILQSNLLSLCHGHSKSNHFLVEGRIPLTWARGTASTVFQFSKKKGHCTPQRNIFIFYSVWKINSIFLNHSINVY